MLKYSISAHFVKKGQVGGAEHMLYNLVNGILSHDVQLCLLANCRENLGDSLRDLPEKNKNTQIFYSNCKAPRFVAEQRASLFPKHSSESILFPNYFTPPLISNKMGRVVTVIHDLQYLHYPDYFSAKKRAWLKFSHLMTLEKADHVIAISNFVREDIVKNYGTKYDKKLSVVHNPVSWDRFGQGSGSPPLGGRPYILSVAAQYPHKNLETAIKAFAKIAPSFPDVHYILAGQVYEALSGVPARQVEIGKLIHQLGLGERIHISGYVDDLTLGNLYRHASAFIFPSVFEGFGLPPVEALGFGIPTITTTSASLPEVTKGLARYIDKPYMVDEWAMAIEQLLSSPCLYVISDESVRHLRSTYATNLIGGKYLSLMNGNIIS